jgi:hypothetical protein
VGIAQYPLCRTHGFVEAHREPTDFRLRKPVQEAIAAHAFKGIEDIEHLRA